MAHVSPQCAEIRPLIVAEPMLRAPRPEMVAELNGASSAQQEIMQEKQERKRCEDDLALQKHYRAKCDEEFASILVKARPASRGRVFVRGFSSAPASSRRFWLIQSPSSIDQRCGCGRLI